MTEKSRNDSIPSDYTEIYSGYSDEELIDVLKKRKHYRKEAAEQAIQEAIKRGIINSEQELFSEEYKVEPLKFSMIPDIENETARKKIRKSLARSLMIVGVLPLVWGGLKIMHNKIPEGILLLILGGLWTFVSFQIYKNNTKWIIIHFILLAGAVIYMIKFFALQKGVNYMDIIIAAIAFGFVLYGLLFFHKLSK